MTDITAPEFNAQHDFRPTHAARPDWLEAARQAKLYAERIERDVCDAFERGDAEYPAVALAQEQAQAASQMYDELYHFWQAGAVPESVALKLDTLVTL